MTPGRLIAVVGPSGVGKDTVMRGLSDTMPELHLVRRVITRAPDLGGEDNDAVSESTFESLVENGAFIVHWGAHGLYYGVPRTTLYQINKGIDCLVNFSRKALAPAAEIFPNFIVLNITARPETLAARLSARGRETEDQIRKRLAEAQKPLPDDITAYELPNDGPLHQTISQAIAMLQVERV